MPSETTFTDIGNEMKLATDEDGDLFIYHGSAAHEPHWQTMAFMPSQETPFNCAIVGCPTHGYIDAGKWKAIE